jgi:hypothetical protein
MFPFKFWSTHVSSVVVCSNAKDIKTAQHRTVKCKPAPFTGIIQQAVVNMEISLNIFRHANGLEKDIRHNEMHLYIRVTYLQISVVVHLSISTRSINSLSCKILIFFIFDRRHKVVLLLLTYLLTYSTEQSPS